MLDSEDIKKLTEYQLEVFKDVFVNKEDLKKVDVKIDDIQNSLDLLLKDKKIKDEESIVANHRVKALEDWTDKASRKLNIKFEH